MTKCVFNYLFIWFCEMENYIARGCVIFGVILYGAVINSVAASEALETELYTDLFSNYSTALRPILSTGSFTQQIIVSAQFGIGQVESLNEKDQQLTTHGYISLSWTDELLTWNTANYGGQPFIIVPANTIWLPEITPINSKLKETMENKYIAVKTGPWQEICHINSTLSVLGATEVASLRDDTRVRIFYDGTVIWLPALKMKTTCSVDVTDFPYDCQTCEISYANWMYTAELLNFSVNPVVIQNGLSANMQWTIKSTEALFIEMSQDGIGSIPVLQMKVSLQRNPKFFELNVLLPALLLAFLLIPMFMLPVESGEKVALGVTLMLAYTLFLLMMTDVTPKSGTTPRLTILILICTIVNGIAVAISVLVINVHHHSPYRPVPNWLKNLILGKLAHILCCMRYMDENEVQPFTAAATDDNISSDIHRDVSEKKNIGISNDYNGHADIAAILNHAGYFKLKKLEEDLVAGNKDDWNKIARVLDRFFLVVFSVFFVCYVMAVLGIKYK